MTSRMNGEPIGDAAFAAVVIGASAGGVEALVRIFSELPDDVPAAFFVVLHLHPRLPSRLREILARAGGHCVLTVDRPLEIRAGTVYVATSDRHMILRDGAVLPSDEARENHARPAIDTLFRSAAIARGARTVGVILSGTLYDGSAGLRWIARVGGCTLVQDPHDAAFGAMPASAIATTSVDEVLPLAELPAAIGRAAAAVAKRGAGAAIAEGAGPVSEFVCPDCGGTLYERGEHGTLRFRCRTGHAYAPEALVDLHTTKYEEAVFTAVRTLQEHEALTRRLAAWARDIGMPHIAERFETAERDARQRLEGIAHSLAADRPELFSE